MKAAIARQKKNPTKYGDIQLTHAKYLGENGAGKLAYDLYEREQVKALQKELKIDKAQARQHYHAKNIATAANFANLLSATQKNDAEASTSGSSPPRKTPLIFVPVDNSSSEGKGNTAGKSPSEDSPPDSATAATAPKATQKKKSSNKSKAKGKAGNSTQAMKRDQEEDIDKIIDDFKRDYKDAYEVKKMTPEEDYKFVQDIVQEFNKGVRHGHLKVKAQAARHMKNPDKYRDPGPILEEGNAGLPYARIVDEQADIQKIANDYKLQSVKAGELCNAMNSVKDLCSKQRI